MINLFNTESSGQMVLRSDKNGRNHTRRFNSLITYLNRGEVTQTIMIMMCKYYTTIQKMFLQYTKINQKDKLLPRQMKSFKLVNSVTGVMEHQEAFNKRVEQAMCITGYKQMLNIVNNIIKFAIQDCIFKETPK